jgi:hypothetical protein
MITQVLLQNFAQGYVMYLMQSAGVALLASMVYECCAPANFSASLLLLCDRHCCFVDWQNLIRSNIRRVSSSASMAVAGQCAFLPVEFTSAEETRWRIPHRTTFASLLLKT